MNKTTISHSMSLINEPSINHYNPEQATLAAEPATVNKNLNHAAKSVRF